MSRSGYVDDDGDDNLAMGRWRGAVASAIRGKRGQAFLKDLIEALDAMPHKILIKHDLIKNGEVCALGALGIRRRMNLDSLDPENYELVSKNFGIAEPLAREIVFMNDEYCDSDSPENRWYRIRTWAERKLNKNNSK